MAPHLDEAPKRSALRLNLASAYLRAAREEEALALAEEAIAHAPEDDEALGVLFAALLGLGDIAAARTRWNALPATQRDKLLDVEIELVDLDKGRAAALSRLDACDPSAEMRSRLVQKLAAWGEFDAAERLLRDGLDKGQGGQKAFRTLGQIAKWQKDDPLLSVLETEASRRDQSPGRRVSLLLSLAKARADIGDHKAAFDATREGKGLWADAVEYDPKAEWRGMEKTLSRWTAERVAALGADGQDDRRPVFILGLPRSGSTLMETILARHPLVRTIGESPRAFTLASKVEAKPDSIADMRDALEPLFAPRVLGERVVDKLPANFKVIGALLAAFPQARFVFPDRDLRATGLSIFENPLGPVGHPYSLTIERIGHHMVNCERMVSAWEARFPDRVTRVSYEALVSDPDQQVPGLVAAAGLDWDEAVRDTARAPKRIDTLSVAQARAPISTASVARWQRHEEDLAPMIAILKDAGLIADKA